MLTTLASVNSAASAMTLLTPTLRLQQAATASRHALSIQPPIQCTTSPCYCKPAFQAIRFQGPIYPIRLGHVDDVDAFPLLEWLPYCTWDGRWQRYGSGHHSTELTVPHTDIEAALQALVAAGLKQLDPINTFWLSVDEAAADRVTVWLADSMFGLTRLHDRLRAWTAVEYNRVGWPAQSSFTCARPDLQRTLSALYEFGFSERPPAVEGKECDQRSLARRWSSAALLRGRDGAKERTSRIAPRNGSASKGENKPLFARDTLMHVTTSSSGSTAASGQSSAMEVTNNVEAANQPIGDERKEETMQEKNSVV